MFVFPSAAILNALSNAEIYGTGGVEFGILRGPANTGLSSELLCVFSTPLSVISNQPVFAQDMLNLKRRVGSQNVQRWEIEANIAPSNNSPGFLVHSVANGHDSVFRIRMPQVYGMMTSATYPSGSIVSTATAAYLDTLPISGVIPSIGEFIQFEDAGKVYLVIGKTATTIQISPSLRSTIAVNTPLIRGKYVTMSAYYDSAVKLGITYVDGVLSDPGSAHFIEAI
jgi:hypothetical protein